MFEHFWSFLRLRALPGAMISGDSAFLPPRLLTANLFFLLSHPCFHMNTFTPGGRSDLGGNRAENSFNFFVITKQADCRRIDALNCGVGEDS